MQYTFDGYNYFIKINRGESLSVSLLQFIKETHITGGWIQGIGAVEQVTLGFYDITAKRYNWKTFDGLREVASLQGNIAAAEDGTMMYHMHGVFSDDSFATVGGHVKDAIIGGTLELFVHTSHVSLQRKTDSNVGLQVLQLHASA